MRLLNFTRQLQSGRSHLAMFDISQSKQWFSSEQHWLLGFTGYVHHCFLFRPWKPEAWKHLEAYNLYNLLLGCLDQSSWICYEFIFRAAMMVRKGTIPTGGFTMVVTEDKEGDWNGIMQIYETYWAHTSLPNLVRRWSEKTGENRKGELCCKWVTIRRLLRRLQLNNVKYGKYTSDWT